MIEFDIHSMSCGHCVGRVTEAVESADPQARVDVDLQTKKVRIETTADRAVLTEALTKAGYPPQ